MSSAHQMTIVFTGGVAGVGFSGTYHAVEGGMDLAALFFLFQGVCHFFGWVPTFGIFFVEGNFFRTMYIFFLLENLDPLTFFSIFFSPLTTKRKEIYSRNNIFFKNF